jgi:hypothetical protein
VKETHKNAQAIATFAFPTPPSAFIRASSEDLNGWIIEEKEPLDGKIVLARKKQTLLHSSIYYFRKYSIRFTMASQIFRGTALLIIVLACTSQL